MKHNKKRNTAFLYEALIKELTKAALRSDKDSKSIVSSILKEHFNSGALLSKELNLYKTICDTQKVSKDTAEKILSEVKRVYHSLGQEELYDEQTQVIKKINKGLSKDVFNNFISNYKTLATISQMFNGKTPINKRIMLEQKIVDQMVASHKARYSMKPIDNITYKMFVQKFNEKYGDSLNEHQKVLLSKYVVLSSETSTEFKIYINEEIQRLKDVVKGLQGRKEVLLDESLSDKNREVLSVLKSFKTQQINDDMIKKILKIQALAEI